MSNHKEGKETKKPSAFARLFGKFRKSSSKSVLSSTSTSNTSTIDAGPLPGASSWTFDLGVTKDMWPEFTLGDDPLQAVGKLFFDFTDSIQKRWASGEDIGTQFGTSIFPTENPTALPPSPIPKRLFDLHQNQVVTTVPTDNVPYTIISHVWGDNPVLVDGSKYGVEWQIPIRRKVKLDQMLMSARVIGGLRYVWIDVLCLDQRVRNEQEVALMGDYYARARGCLVWLDNAGSTNASDEWNAVLSAIKDVNKFFKMDHSGVLTVSAGDMMNNGFGFGDLSLDGGEALSYVRKIKAIENCPWFHRIWTLQEAVIPENLYFCTPERYMCGGASLFQIIGVCGMMAKLFMGGGEMVGIAITHELQKSELWKTLRLRQLYRKKQISFWHLYQATRNRTSKFEQDRVFGTAGLIHGRVPVIDYARSQKELYSDLYRSSLERGDFAALMFLGDGETPIEPDAQCIPHIISPAAPVTQETHSMSMTPTGELELKEVGLDNITRVYPIVTGGSLRAWNHPEFLNLSTPDHIAIATAFGMNPETIGTGAICPAAFAAFSSMTPLPSHLMAAFGRDFQEKYEILIPQGFLQWMKVSMLMLASEDYAFVVIWTASNEPMLGMVNEKVTGTVFIVTPSSYTDTPGEGCMICILNPDRNGTLRKIGLGFGRNVKADRKVAFEMV